MHYASCIGLSIGLAVLGVGCKPTEGNYRKAYEAAVQKRTQADPDADILYGGHRPASPLGAIEEKIGADTFYTLRTPVEVVEGDEVLDRQPCRVAVAFFRMKANALSDAASLRGAGISRAGVVTAGEEKYFVVVASAPNPVEAAQLAAAYASRHSDIPYIGLGHDSPLLLLSPR